MAKEELVENEEFITLDDDEIDELFEDVVIAQEDENNLPTKTNRLLYILISIFTVIAFGLLGFLFYLYLNKDNKSKDINETKEIITKVKDIEKNITIQKTKSYQELINKADKLYNSGKKEEALKIHKEILSFSKALSNYNIGVTKLKEKKYDKAIEFFLKSYKEPRLVFESAINISIASLYNGEHKNFKTYLEIATQSLPTRINSPLYSYYRTLTDYYRGFFIETLVPLENRTSKYYTKKQNKLEAKILTSCDNPKKAISILEQNGDEDDMLSLGLMYATQKEYEIAKKHITKYINSANSEQLRAKMALALIDIKTGMLKEASTYINESYIKYKKEAQSIYPIKSSLKKSLFDPVIAQIEFQKNLFFNEKNRFSLLFYFAPYKLMDPKLSIDRLNKGANEIYINQLTPALKQLNLGGNIADASMEITNGIQAALNKDLLTAKNIFLKGIKKYPSSSSLHYNLALIYAKMFQFQDAKKHFKKSYILDNKNYLATIFDYCCSKLLYENTDDSDISNLREKLLNEVPDNLSKKRAIALIAIAKNEIIQIDKDINQTLFDDTIKLVLAQILQDTKLYKNSTKDLLKKAKSNLIANILSIDANNDKSDIKSYAKAIQEKLLDNDLNYHNLYDNHTLVRELYVQMLSISGIVSKLKKDAEKRLAKKGDNDIATLQTLAYCDIYLQEFEQAYAIYNKLIDELKVQDSNTLFLGAIASIGAKHHENAIALLELAKLTNSANLESRFALGILYHEVKNLEAAAIQYAKIGDIGFKSHYFELSLDKSKP